MALEIIPEEEDLYLYEVLRHPVFCWEFIQNLDKLEHEEEFEFTDYQKEFICDFNPEVYNCSARASGKTEAISGIFTWTIVTKIFEEYVVYLVPNKAQLEPVWQRITRMFRTNSFLRNLVEPKKGINSGTNQIFTKHGAVLMCRIAGTTGDGRNVIGLHTPFQMVDESGYFPWGTYLELQPTWNTWTAGRRKIVSGVPTGMRESNVLYHA